MTRVLALIIVSSFLIPAALSAPPPSEAHEFDALVGKHPDLTYDGLRALVPKPAYSKLSFDPKDAAYYDLVTDGLQLTAKERAMLRETGLVSIDHRQRYSMGAAYYSIYTTDLPVLITTDSILHAVHRSYDAALKELEIAIFIPTLDRVLSDAHAAVAKGSANNALRDADLYLSVARNLLAGAGGPKTSADGDAWDGRLKVRSRRGQDAKVLYMLKLVESLKLQPPLPKTTDIYGGKRHVDYSQMKPRGHYTEALALRRYFRAMMWLGRADTGFNVLPAPMIDAPRERAAVAVVTRVLRDTGGISKLRSLSDLIDFLIGRGDDLSVFQLATMMDQVGMDSVARAADLQRGVKLGKVIDASDYGRQQIRSQLVVSDPNSPIKAPLPVVAQVFGQRFLIDSFVLSKVVFDSILFEGRKQRRMMPKGLDVMAALGNSEAITLLQKDLTKHKYGSNLWAARELVARQPKSVWDANLYNIWLSSLATLDDVPADAKYFPQAMRTRAWAHKQLQTQLGSWSELRHDTILYGKQSYTAFPSCEYPTGYVEPYPAFYDRLAFFAAEAGRRMKTADLLGAEHVRTRQLAYFAHLETTMKRLSTLAHKELAGKPFTPGERGWLKQTLDQRGGGSGPPRYDGWYPKLVYGGEPAKYKPTIADVHTDPESGKVLEVGVGCGRRQLPDHGHRQRTRPRGLRGPGLQLLRVSPAGLRPPDRPAVAGPHPPGQAAAAARLDRLFSVAHAG